MNEEQIVNIRKMKIECTECNSELIFDATQTLRSDRSLPHHCPMCGNNYGMNPDDNPIIIVQRLLKSVEQSKGATMSFLCEEVQK